MYSSTNERGTRRQQDAAGLHNTAAASTNPTFGESPVSGPAPTTAGHHKHDVLNKLDPRVDSTKDQRPMAAAEAPAGTYGPHKSRLANTLDPRVDSDGSSANRHHNTGAAATGYGAGASTMGGNHNQGMGMGNSTMHGGGNSGVPEGTYGPHSSRMANAMDPRVDSDMDSARAGYGAGMQQPYGTTGTHGAHGTHGTHAAQPSHGLHGSSRAVDPIHPGPAPHTAGPHKSDLLNKLDPLVDSKATRSTGGAGYDTQQQRY
ncbi:hypothetical protein B0T17DRAFT_492221 [Bombardia bombarda]|uniref:Uncharacterized protein n=1 Tax=Bombardia bombarda TaxID=252184 RepID=A0AA39X120_9PEZI|nr:hypothetical protein B0T17DRAFT_492221 [Bombardia bombarda]